MDVCFLLPLLLVVNTVAILEDPLCVTKNCSPMTVCRVVTECHLNSSCQLNAMCLDNPPRYIDEGVCQIGYPIKVLTNGFLNDTVCSLRLPCPTGTYCNTEMMDTYHTCCRSDPAKPVRQGECPGTTGPKNSVCIDSCENDGDCRDTIDKCCLSDGCRLCMRPTVPDPCISKQCPLGKYCLRPHMTRCQGPGVCWEIGECVPCRPFSPCSKTCLRGYDTDVNGCHICQCKHVISGPPFRGETNLMAMRPATPTNVGAPHNANHVPDMLWMYMFYNK